VWLVTPWVKRLIIANVIVFFLQQMSGYVTGLLQFRPDLLVAYPWTIYTVVTYMFVHDPHSITHILFNMIALYFFGPRVEERLGAGRFIALYFLSGIAGAALSFVLAPQSAIIGASGAVLGVMFAFARFWPRAQIYVWFIPLEARIWVVLLALYNIYSGFNGQRGGVANFAHLGGMAGAWLFLLYVERTQGTKKFRAKTTAPVGKDALDNWRRIDTQRIHEVNRDEVNRILDKISAGGLGSLTAQERLFLSNFVPMDDRMPPVS
jgi:membrane associated rhomboid family serine protease